MKVNVIPYTLTFKNPAGTSRGTYYNHKVWYVVITLAEDPLRWGIGECAPLIDLSPEYKSEFDYEETLKSFCQILERDGNIDKDTLRPYPSIQFGLETALMHLKKKGFEMYDTAFTKGCIGIPINGLVWMGDYDYMLNQVNLKIHEGCRCIKIKIGAIDFEKEIELLQYIRKQLRKDKVSLRVDANGAFSSSDALEKLERLAELDLHSIEQPIKAGQWNEMAKLTKVSPLPIALDEELIGIDNISDKRQLLETIRPQYIVLKPSLHGGIGGSEEWIRVAESMDIGWWITSALESNIGLNMLSQWASTFDLKMPQGLGTGSLYTNNLRIPLIIKGNCLWYDPYGRKFSLNELLQ